MTVLSISDLVFFCINISPMCLVGVIPPNNIFIITKVRLKGSYTFLEANVFCFTPLYKLLVLLDS